MVFTGFIPLTHTHTHIHTHIHTHTHKYTHTHTHPHKHAHAHTNFHEIVSFLLIILLFKLEEWEGSRIMTWNVREWQKKV